MALDVQIQRFHVEDKYFFRGATTVIGGGGGSGAPSPVRHWEIATLINLQSKHVFIAFDDPFVNEPVGTINIYRMVAQSGGYVEQNVVLTYPNEVKYSKTGFEFNIAAFEQLIGVIVKYMFSEGNIVDGGTVPPPDIDLLSGLEALYDMENAVLLLDKHGNSDGDNTDIVVVTSDILTPAYKYDSATAKTLIPETVDILVDAFVDSYSIEIWFKGDKNNINDLFRIITNNISSDTAPASFNLIVMNTYYTVFHITDGTNNTHLIMYVDVLDNQWHQLVMTVDHSTFTAKGYVDGVEQANTPLNITGTTVDTDAGIGIMLAATDNNPANQPLEITRFALWRKALSDDERTALYNLGNGKLYSEFSSHVL